MENYVWQFFDCWVYKVSKIPAVVSWIPQQVNNRDDPRILLWSSVHKTAMMTFSFCCEVFVYHLGLGEGFYMKSLPCGLRVWR